MSLRARPSLHAVNPAFVGWTVLALLSVVFSVRLFVPRGSWAAILVSSRSDILSNSQSSATSNNTIAFTIQNSLDTTGWGQGNGGDATDTLAIVFPSGFNLANLSCKDVDISFGGTATSIAGYNVNRSTSTNCKGSATSWGLFIDTSANALTFYTPTAVRTYVATGTQVSILIGTNASFQDAATQWITNPSSAGTYTISVGGTFNGSGNILVSINSGVTVQATVAESLALTVSSVKAVNCTADDGATVTAIDTTSTTIPFGNVSLNTFYIGCQDLVVSTNAGNGYSVTVQESSAMKTVNGQFTIPDTTCDAGNCTVVTATTWVTPTKNGFGHTCFNQSGSDCSPIYGNGNKFKPLPNVPMGTVPGNISLVQKATVSSFGPTNGKSAVFASGTATGNAIIAFVYWYDNSPETATVSDSSSNAYVAVGNPTCNVGFECGQFYYAMNVKGGTSTATVALTQNSNRLGLEIYEYSGLAQTAMLDTSAGQAAPSSTNQATTPYITTQSPTELLISGFADNNGGGTITAGSGWTMEQTDTGFYSGGEDEVASIIGPYQGTATLPNTDNIWIGIIAAFRASGTPVAIMSNTGTATSTGRVKYRLSAGAAQPAGTYTTLITYTILGTF